MTDARLPVGGRELMAPVTVTSPATGSKKDLDRRTKPGDNSGSVGQSSSDARGQTVLAGPPCPCKTGLMTLGKGRKAVSRDVVNAGAQHPSALTGASTMT